jgi:hypothetical protein
MSHPLDDLAHGNWPAVIDLLASDRRSVVPAEVADIVGESAWAMCHHARGDAVETRARLDRVIARFPALYRTGRPGCWRVVRPQPPRNRDGIEWWVWVLSRVVDREQVEILDATRICCGPDATARDVLVHAVVEHMVLVEYVPHLHVPGISTYGLPVEPTSTNARRRATDLRHLGNPRAPDVNKSVWDDAGELAGLRLAAMYYLFRTYLARNAPARRSTDLPPKVGLVLALEMARLWGGTLGWDRDD